MSLYTSLNIGRGALQIAQMGMQVTSQNIANVNTQGYKRQRMEQANMPYGLGVTLNGISRMRSSFAEKQLLGITSGASKSEITNQTYSNLETLFDEISGRGLDPEFNDFFKALQDLAARPGGAAERATLRSRGNSIGQLFGFLHQQMDQQVRNQDIDLENMVSRANGLIRDIAELNRRIGAGVGHDLGTNELRNNRDEAVRKLAELMPVTAMEDGNGNFSVYIQNGMPLLAGSESFELQLKKDVTDDLKYHIIWASTDGASYDVTAQMTSGSIGGVLENRDVIIPEQMKRLDQLAAEFVKHFNDQHRNGTGLDGVGNRNFFEPTPVYTRIGQGNQGGATITAASVIDSSALTLNDYEMQIIDNGGGLDYKVINKTTGATLGTGAYVSGMNLTFDGLSITIGDVSGPPQVGDIFSFNTVTNAAANIKVSSAILASLDAIAAGSTSTSGDNRNALALADLENRRVASGGTLSFQEMYHAMLVELGVDASAQELENESQTTLLSQSKNMVESISGVNIDEEATSLMQYQHAYQAAAKVISTVDDMLQTLINAI